MSKDQRHIGHEDFRRYLENRMNEQERHAFERELQKDPFLAEAFEGYEQVDPSTFETDVLDLKQKIGRKKSSTPKRVWYAAASILLLITAGTLFFLVQNKPESPEIAKLEQPGTGPNIENVAPEPEDTADTEMNAIVLPEDSAEPFQSKNSKVENNTATSTSVTIVENNPPSPKIVEEIEMLDFVDSEEEAADSPQTVQIALSQKSQELKQQEEDKNNVIRIRGVSSVSKKARSTRSFIPMKSDSIPAGFRLIKGRVIVKDDSLPIPGVTIVEQNSGNGTITDLDGNFQLLLSDSVNSPLVASFIGKKEQEFQPGDSTVLISMESDQLALEEVVAIGYGVQTKPDTEEQIRYAHPADGMRAYRKYLEEKAILPADSPNQKVVVKLELTIAWDGSIKDISCKNDIDPNLVELATQIVSEGPAWRAKTINGTPQESVVNLRVVFRK